MIVLMIDFLVVPIIIFILYFRQGGYVYIGVCLFVCRITQNPLSRFSQNWVER